MFFWLDHVLVKRVGYGLMGFYGESQIEEFQKSSFSSPSEIVMNDLGHLASGTIILFLLKIFFGDDISGIDWLEQIEEHLVHEVGEVEHGDTPNNGTVDRERKEQREFETAKSLFRHFPQPERDEQMSLYLRNLEGKDFCKMVDRACFVWGIGWMNYHGINGNMDVVPGKGVGTDSKMAKLAQSDDPFPAMFVEFLIFSRNFQYREIFIGITEAMYQKIYHTDVPHHIKKLY